MVLTGLALIDGLDTIAYITDSSPPSTTHQVFSSVTSPGLEPRRICTTSYVRFRMAQHGALFP